MPFVSHSERDAIRKRQEDDIAAAKARGIKLGRPSVEVPDDFEEIAILNEQKKITLQEALEHTGLKQTTFYARSREFRENRKK